MEKGNREFIVIKVSSYPMTAFVIGILPNQQIDTFSPFLHAIFDNVTLLHASDHSFRRHPKELFPWQTSD
jgi:predicted ribonuclease YlaK